MGYDTTALNAISAEVDNDVANNNDAKPTPAILVDNLSIVYKRCDNIGAALELMEIYDSRKKPHNRHCGRKYTYFLNF